MNHELGIMNDNKTSGRGVVKKSGKAAIKILTARENEDHKDKILAQDANEPRPDAKKVEQKKKLIMWVGISSIMALFFIIWIFNLENEFNKASANKSRDPGPNWSQTKTELDRAMKQVKDGIAQIKQMQKSAQNILPAEPKLTPEQINLLKGKLLNETATSTTASTTSGAVRR